MENNVIKPKKIGLWNQLGIFLKYAGYLVIFVECAQLFISRAKEYEEKKEA